MQIVSGGVTNVGRVRTNNEDCFRIVEALNLFVLSDGMGGEAHGEIASALAVDMIVKHCQETENDPAMTIFGDMPAGWSEKTRRLSSALGIRSMPFWRTFGIGSTIRTCTSVTSRLISESIQDSTK